MWLAQSGLGMYAIPDDREPVSDKYESLQQTRASVLVSTAQQLYKNGMQTDYEVTSLLQLYDPLIQKVASINSHMFNVAWEECKSVVQSLFWELVMEYDPHYKTQTPNKRGFSKVYFSHYISRKLGMRARWVLSKHAKREQAEITKDSEPSTLFEGSYVKDLLRFVAQRLGEERADMVYGYYVLGLTQRVLAELFNTHQVAVSLRLREALALLKEELSDGELSSG